MPSNFATTVSRIRERLQTQVLRGFELRELLDQLDELQAALPLAPERPQFVEPELWKPPTTDGLSRKQQMAVERDARARNHRIITQARLEHQEQEANWREQNKAWQSEHGPQVATQTRIVNNLQSEIRAILDGAREQFPVQTLPWRFLPKSEMNEENVVSTLRLFQHRRPDLRVDESRLRWAFQLRPENVYVGQDEFDGYFAFCFANEKAVLLDHPVVGNGAYVFGENWRALSRLTKRELLNSRSGRRIVHNGDWRRRVREVLSRREQQRPRGRAV
jgi:hypothetical protein